MFVGLSTLDDLDAPPLSASNRCIQTPPAHRSAPRGLGDHGDGGGPKLAPLQRRPDPAVFAGGAGGEARRVVQTEQDRRNTRDAIRFDAGVLEHPAGSRRGTRGQFVSGQLPHGRRSALLDTIGQRRRSLDWTRRGHSADWHQKSGFYALDARRTCRTMVKALGCDRDACTNGYQIRQCQPRASGLRRT
jgi:hypothetical protein